MTRLGFVVDITKCLGCGVCDFACKDEYEGNDYLPYSKAQPETQYGYDPSFYPSPAPHVTVRIDPGQFWIKTNSLTRGKVPKVKAYYLTMPCMHCDNPACARGSSNGAVVKRNDGIVLIDPAKASGQNGIVTACPYGRVYWNSAANLPQKCTMCAHLVDAGGKPKCVESCPLTAIMWGNLDDPSSDVAKAVASGARPLHPEYGTQPKVFYLGLPKTFLAGALTDASGKYLGAANITLKTMSGRQITTTSDEFGDFIFDNLDAKQTYMLAISKTGYFNKSLMMYLETDKDIGKIQLVGV